MEEGQNQTKRPKMDFSKLSSGGGIMNITTTRRTGGNQYRDLKCIERALEVNDLDFLRQASDYYFQWSGVYGRLVRYASNILTFDSLVYPVLDTQTKKKSSQRITKEFNEVLNILDDFNLKKVCRDIVHTVVKSGVYYGYLRTDEKKFVMQDLPVNYCRVIRKISGIDLVEFDVKYFEATFPDAAVRQSVLRTYPREIQTGYLNYLNGSLKMDVFDRRYWIPLELKKAVKFCFTGSEIPLFIQTLPELLALEEAKGIQKKKSIQELSKVLVQKFELNDDYEPVFEMGEIQVLHRNAVTMLGGTEGVDVLSTFADIDLLSVVDKNNNGSFEYVKDSRNSVFAEAGVSEQIFATDGNLALEKSILSDEAIMFSLLHDIQTWINTILKDFGGKKTQFKVLLPRITVFNSQKMVELYKGLATIGFSKVLPGLITGQTQEFVISNMDFENDILGLQEKMTPVSMSSTQSSSSASVGRPAKSDDEKSEKTIANITSAS